MTSGALETVTPIGAAEAKDAPRSKRVRGVCVGVRREDEMGAAGKRATRADQGVARRHAVRRGDTAAAGLPRAHGLYDPALDKDSCGVGFIADIKGRKSH